MGDRLRRAGRSRQAIVAALAVGGTAAAILLIGQAAHFGELLRRLRHATPGWLIACAVGEVLAYLGFFASYQAMAESSGGPRIPAPVVVRVVGLSFGAFSVATAIGGLSVDFWALREAGEPGAMASARVIALETLRWAVLGVASMVAAIAVLIGSGHRLAWPIAVAWLVVVPACFAGGIWVSVPGRRERLRGQNGGRLRRAFGVALTALELLGQLRTGPRGVRRRAVSGAALFWAGELLCAWAALRAFGTSVGVAPLLLGYATGKCRHRAPAARRWLGHGGCGTDGRLLPRRRAAQQRAARRGHIPPVQLLVARGRRCLLGAHDPRTPGALTPDRRGPPAPLIAGAGGATRPAGAPSRGLAVSHRPFSDR